MALKMWTILACVMAVACAAAEPAGLERYRGVIERRPFGAEPAGFDPEKPGSGGGRGAAGAADAEVRRQEEQEKREEQKLLAAVRIVALNVRPDGRSMVGFIDGTRQPASSYYMSAGETRDGWSVLGIDVAAKTVALKKDGIEIELGLGQDARDLKAKKEEAAKAAERREAPAGMARSVKERRAQREAAERRRNEERERQERMERENLRKAEELQRAHKAHMEETVQAIAQLQQLGEMLRSGRNDGGRQEEKEAAAAAADAAAAAGGAGAEGNGEENVQ